MRKSQSEFFVTAAELAESPLWKTRAEWKDILTFDVYAKKARIPCIFNETTCHSRVRAITCGFVVRPGTNEKLFTSLASSKCQSFLHEILKYNSTFSSVFLYDSEKRVLEPFLLVLPSHAKVLFLKIDVATEA